MRRLCPLEGVVWPCWNLCSFCVTFELLRGRLYLLYLTFYLSEQIILPSLSLTGRSWRAPAVESGGDWVEGPLVWGAYLRWGPQQRLPARSRPSAAPVHPTGGWRHPHRDRSTPRCAQSRRAIQYMMPNSRDGWGWDETTYVDNETLPKQGSLFCNVESKLKFEKHTVHYLLSWLMNVLCYYTPSYSHAEVLLCFSVSVCERQVTRCRYTTTPWLPSWWCGVRTAPLLWRSWDTAFASTM